MDRPRCVQRIASRWLPHLLDMGPHRAEHVSRGHGALDARALTSDSPIRDRGVPDDQTGQCATALRNPSQAIQVRAGDTFAVAFNANLTTGFSWNVTSEPDPAVATVLGTENLPPNSPALGAPAAQCFAFQAVGAGS
jgi:predicted secreted protein